MSAEQVLEEELASSFADNYDLSILYLYNDNSLSEESIKANLDEDYTFAYELGYLIILPFYDANEANRTAEKAKQYFADADFAVATKDQKSTAEQLLSALK